MPILQVQIVTGHTSDQKVQLAHELTDTVERVLGSPRAAIRVLLHETPPENWYRAGTSLASSANEK